jgi:hypothetical protein
VRGGGEQDRRQAYSEVGDDKEHGENSGGRTRLGGGDCHAEGGFEQQPGSGSGDR